ncbi:hypothetical protein FOG48_04095 [Hanseniaspora uvarum]|nr:hypothetical protein FOG48_04095 [Hanseniaspora uvarum]
MQSIFNSSNKSSDSIKNKLLNQRLVNQKEKIEALKEIQAVTPNSRKDKQIQKTKKTKNNDDDDDLEARYHQNLVDNNLNDDVEDKEEENEEDKMEVETEVKSEKIDIREEELEKASKTIFIGNLPQSVLTDNKIYKKFIKLFSTPITEGDHEVISEEQQQLDKKNYKVKSCRFRSLAFSEPLPKAVAFKQLKLDSKRDSINSYLVYENHDKKTLSKIIKYFNGFVFENHHIRVDSVLNPAKQDTTRSVFVGNLDFEELEENLYVHFQQLATETPNEKLIEYVRIVRDSKTQMGKGFAYVQFYDSSYVNKAIELLNGKKIVQTVGKKPRELRVTRCKKTFTPVNGLRNDNKKVTALNDKQKSKLGRAQKVLGKMDRKLIRESLTIEGERANQDKQKQKGFKVSKMLSKSVQKVKKPRSKEGRSALRSAVHKQKQNK